MLTEKIVSWLNHYDSVLKMLVVLATPGGLWFWIDKYRNRIQARIRNLRLPTDDRSLQKIAFDVENISSVLTSLEPTFLLSGYSSGRILQTYQFAIEGNDRQLPPHVTRAIQAKHHQAENDVFVFLWYMTITVQLTRGCHARFRVRNADFERIGFFRFHFERIRFLLTGVTPYG